MWKRVAQKSENFIVVNGDLNKNEKQEINRINEERKV